MIRLVALDPYGHWNFNMHVGDAKAVMVERIVPPPNAWLSRELNR